MRKKLIIACIFFVVACISQPALAASKTEPLSPEEAKGILSGIIPNVTVIHVQPSPSAGLWEIGVDMGGRKAIIYLDHAKQHIISPATGGNLISLKTKANLTQESFQKITRVDAAKIPLKDALVLGDKSAKNKVIVFDDPD